MLFSLFNDGMGNKGIPALRGRLFYGWVVVASCLLIATTLFGIRFSFGVFFKSLETEFDWTRAATSALFSLYMILCIVVAILGGWASDKYGPKRVVLAMGAITGLSLLLTGRVESTWQLYFTYSFLLALGTGSAYTIVMSAGSRWFLRNRATVLGIIGAGGGLGTMLLAPVTAWLISVYDWRSAYLALGIVAWVVIIPSALLLKKDPQEIGAQPDGGPISTTSGPAEPADTEEFSLTGFLKSRSFWLFFIIWLAYSFCLHMVMTHIVPRAEDLGIAPVQAAAILSVLTAVGIPSRILIGRVSDRINKRIIGIALALLHTVAMLWLMSCTQLWMFFLFAVIYGLAYGGLDPPVIALIAEIFGLRRIGVIIGILGVGWGLGAAMGSYLSGLIFDLTGSYQFAFLSGALIMVLAAICIYGLRTPQQGEG